MQRELMSQYHVTDAEGVLRQGGLLGGPGRPDAGRGGGLQPGHPGAPAPATTNSGGDGPAQPPYYVLLQFPGQDKPQFSLTSTFVARGRPNLTAFAAVSSDPGDYGKIRVLQLPKGTVIAGPGLVANQFESNTEVSTKLSLLRSGGSEVVLGNLLTLPVGNGLLYIEPVYTQGRKEPKFPILNCVIVSFGSKIVYKPTLARGAGRAVRCGHGRAHPRAVAPRPVRRHRPHPRRRRWSRRPRRRSPMVRTPCVGATSRRTARRRRGSSSCSTRSPLGARAGPGPSRAGVPTTALPLWMAIGRSIWLGSLASGPGLASAPGRAMVLGSSSMRMTSSQLLAGGRVVEVAAGGEGDALLGEDLLSGAALAAQRVGPELHGSQFAGSPAGLL